MFCIERSTIETSKREVATLTSKYESCSNEVKTKIIPHIKFIHYLKLLKQNSKLSEYKVKFQAREDRINELKREMDTLKNENATMNALICTQRTKIKELEGDLGGFESVASKSGITITTLQKDNKELQQNVLELESRIRYLFYF
jgi:chromosome segregation ATPase